MIVPISAGLLVDVRAYHRALDAYREDDPDVVVGENKHSMGRTWRSEEVLRALDAFAQHSGRRGRAD